MDLSALDARLRRSLAAAFAPQRLARLEADARDPGAADLRACAITLYDAEGRRSDFRLREDQIPPDLMDLIDEI